MTDFLFEIVWGKGPRCPCSSATGWWRPWVTDRRFQGICCSPRDHHETLADLRQSLLVPLFGSAQRLARGPEAAVEAQSAIRAALRDESPR